MKSQNDSYIQKAMNNSNKIEYIDFLSIVSAVAVVFLHINGCFWDFSATKQYWISANIIEGLCYFAVPIFFMISGATLIDYNERYSTKSFFKRRIKKTVIPFIVWSLIGVVYRLCIVKDLTMRELSLKWVINGINDTNIVSHLYWFFPALFAVYLAIPVLSAISTEKRKIIFQYIIGIGFVVNMLIPFIGQFFGLSKLSISMIFATNYLIYPITGYYISHYEVSKRGRAILIIAGLGGVILQICGTYYYSTKIGYIFEGFRGYENIPVFVYSVGIFVCAKYYYKNRKTVIGKKIISTIRNYTFSIYLMHWYIYTALIRVFNIDAYSILCRIVLPIIVCAIAIAIAFIIKKIPILRYSLP